MTTTDDETPIRISGPVGLLATVPMMLGFHPTNSLVMMCVSGRRRKVGPVARVDLPPGHDRAMAAHLAMHALQHADEVVLISYQSFRRRPPLLDDVLREMGKVGVEVMDALVVRGGRARPALNPAMERVHPGYPLPGADDPQVRALTAAGALAGRTVLADREELRRSIAGPKGSRLRRAEREISEAACGRLPPFDTSPGLTAADHILLGEMPSEGEDRISRAFGQVSAGDGVRVEVAAALAVLLTERLVRDAVLGRAVVEVDLPWLPMLISCATWTPDPLAPPLCSVLAMVAYRHGDGALAQIAVDRCLLAEPEHPLAHLMIAIMAAGVHPEELERITEEGMSWSLQSMLSTDAPLWPGSAGDRDQPR